MPRRPVPRTKSLEAARDCTFLWTTLLEIEGRERAKQLAACDITGVSSTLCKLEGAAFGVNDTARGAAVLADRAAIGMALAKRLTGSVPVAVTWPDDTKLIVAEVPGEFDLGMWLGATCAAAVVRDRAGLELLLADDVVTRMKKRPWVMFGKESPIPDFMIALADGVRALIRGEPGAATLGAAAEALRAKANDKRWALYEGVGRLVEVGGTPSAEWDVEVIKALNSYDKNIERFGATQWAWPLRHAAAVAIAHDRGVHLVEQHPYFDAALIRGECPPTQAPVVH